MPRFQRPQLTDAVNRFLATLDAAWNPELLDGVSLTVPIVSALDATPYLRLSAPIQAQTSVGAFAAKFSQAIARPSVQTILQFSSVTVNNRAAATGRFIIAISTGAQIAAKVGSLVSTFKFHDLSNGITGALDRPEVIEGYQDAAGVAGTNLAVLDVPPNDCRTFTWQPGYGPALFGNDELGPPGISVSASVVNLLIDVTFSCRAWLIS